jgi:hypothetical protein
MKRRWIIVLAAYAVYLVMVSTAMQAVRVLAAPDAPTETYAIPWWTVDNGGGVSQGGGYVLYGSIAQPDAGSHAGSVYTLKGGFWSGLLNYLLYAPLVNR